MGPVYADIELANPKNLVIGDSVLMGAATLRVLSRIVLKAAVRGLPQLCLSQLWILALFHSTFLRYAA